MRRLRVVLPALFAIVAVACSSGSSAHHAAPTLTVPGGASTSASAAGSTTPTSSSPASQPGSSSTTTAAAAACTTAGLTVTAGPGNGGAGHIGLPILFRNTGTTPCRLHGYPGVAGLNAAGKEMTQAVRTASGYLGGVGGETGGAPTVVLAPGQTASALVEGSDVPVGNATSCPTYVGLLVTPPDETHSVRLGAQLPGCSGLQVHPVVAGQTGSTA